MSPSGLAIILGAGPNTGAGIARILSTQGNLAVALLARRSESLSSIRNSLLEKSPNSVIECFPTDTKPSNLEHAFQDIKSHAAFKNLELKVAIFGIKYSSKKPFMEETHEDFMESLEIYVGGAQAFARESLKLFFEHHGLETLSENGGKKKGTLIFTGTMGAIRANAEFGAYGASRAGVRMLAQSLAREMSVKGIHIVHAIANGGIRSEVDEEVKVGKRMSAEAVGKTYLWLSEQEPELWTHELDMRPAQEKF